MKISTEKGKSHGESSDRERARARLRNLDRGVVRRRRLGHCRALHMQVAVRLKKESSKSRKREGREREALSGVVRRDHRVEDEQTGASTPSSPKCRGAMNRRANWKDGGLRGKGSSEKI